MPSRFFITGTDTGIGKTIVSALLCAALDAIYWKPIQTGAREGTDRDTVIRLAALPRDRALPEAYRFAPPVSPHLAARRAGVRIELRKIKLSPLMLDGNLIVEGAGGALVPINDTQLMTRSHVASQASRSSCRAHFARHHQSHFAFRRCIACCAP